MMGILQEAGHELTASEKEAEIIVVNTCGFIGPAKEESVNTILEMAQYKTSGTCRRLVVAGCLVERYRKELTEQIPEVDVVIGTNEVPRILAACAENGEAVPVSEAQKSYLYSDTDPRILTTPSHFAYVKIAEGCDHPCTFCVIPRMRGRFRSRKPDSIVREVEALADRGVREVNLIAQDSTMYGWDHGNRRGLAELLRRLGEVESLEWIRFLYAYPNSVYDELLEAIAETPKVCNYIDLPLQSASRSVLKRMKRGGNRRSLISLIQRIRGFIPDVAIRTTMIVGFPGETDQDFQELLDFVREVEFDWLGVFPFSDEEDAESFGLDKKVPVELMNERRESLLKVQSEICRRKHELMVGSFSQLLLEGPSRETDLLWEGRLPSQAPEIDGVVYLNDGITDRVKVGEIYRVHITDAHEYDLVGTLLS
jgi:ribosomal protein S12 methylthiotransferase